MVGRFRCRVRCFSAACCRTGGPPPLRGGMAPTIYGFPGLSLEQKESVRVRTLFTVRTSQLASILGDLDRPTLVPARLADVTPASLPTF